MTITFKNIDVATRYNKNKRNIFFQDLKDQNVQFLEITAL